MRALSVRIGRGTQVRVVAKSRRLVWRRKRGIVPYLFIAPYFVVFFAFLLLPALFGVYASFTDWNILGSPNWIGVENYRVLSDAMMFERAFKNTMMFTLYSVPPLVVGGLLLAVLFNQPLRGRIFGRVVAFIPFALMVTVVGILWRWIFDQNFGLLDYYLTEYGIIDWIDKLGLTEKFQINRKGKIPWLTKWPLHSVALTTVWWQIGTNMIIYLAGLQEIPEELYEAAQIDGANGVQRFRHITLPGLQLMHMFVIPMSVISSLRVFGQAHVMTGGGPAGRSYTIVQHLYAVGWNNQRMGEAAAVGVILFAITFLFTLFQLRFIFKAV
ncbi:MAG: sugar ABC transporter permease [Chloroflexi bacterium]|nr:sugar ABC transporter permease [Chloroflexota bacterium]